MSKGVKISKDSEDITRANVEELYVNEEKPIFKLFKVFSGKQHFTGTLLEAHTITIPHRLGYVPFFLFFMDRNPGGTRRLVTTSEQPSTTITQEIICLIDEATLFEIKVTATGNGTPDVGDYGYTCYVYYDKISGAQDG